MKRPVGNYLSGNVRNEVSREEWMASMDNSGVESTSVITY